MLAVTSPRIVGLLLLIAVSLLLSTGILHQPWLMYVFKPLATLLILSISATQWKKQHSPFTLWISIGLLFSLFGDIVLMFPDRFFLFGLISFLLAHISYLIAFSRDVKFPARPSVWLLYLAFVAFFYAFLLPTLPPGLRLPVIIYIFFVASMAAQAMGRFLFFKNLSAASAALGTLLFMLSDALLSVDLFRTPIPAATFFVLVPYYLAQWFIALSTRPVPTIPPSSS